MEMQVVAGGGLVWDRSHLLLVHRPRYDDWTLPKGKIDRVDGGDVLACAVREVREETGTDVSVGARAGQTRYRTAGPGGPTAVKVVDYWHMERTGGNFTPNREVDTARWVTVDEARALLSYERDQLLLEGVTPGKTSALGVFRRFEAAVGKSVDDVDAVLVDSFVLRSGGDGGVWTADVVDGSHALMGWTFTDVAAGPGSSVTFVLDPGGGAERVRGHAVVRDASVSELVLDDGPG